MNTLAHFTPKLISAQQLLETSTTQSPTILSLANPIQRFHYDKQNAFDMREENSQVGLCHSDDEDVSLFEPSSTDLGEDDLYYEAESFDTEDESYLHEHVYSNVDEADAESELLFPNSKKEVVTLNANNSDKKRKASNLSYEGDNFSSVITKKQKTDSSYNKENVYFVNGQEHEVTPDKQNQFGRFAKNPTKSGAYSNGALIGTSSGSYEFGSYNTPEKKTPCRGQVTPNSKTPEYLGTPNGTKLTRVATFGGTSLYMERSKIKDVTVKKKLEFDDVVDHEADCEQLKRILNDTSWEGLKALASNILTTEFDLKPEFIRESGKRAKSQAQVMGNTSAKDAVTKFLETEHSGDPVSAAIDFVYSNFMGQANLLDDQGAIRARTLEYRHLAPFAVCGNKAQIKNNLAIGPAYTNTVEMCIELALYEIANQGMHLTVKVVEHVLGDMNIGIFRKYIIIDNASMREATIEFPTLCCAIKPPLIFKDFMKVDIQLRLGMVKNIS